MTTTIGTLRDEIAELFKEYNELKNYKSDDFRIKEEVNKRKIDLLQSIKSRHDIIFDKLELPYFE